MLPTGDAEQFTPIVDFCSSIRVHSAMDDHRMHSRFMGGGNSANVLRICRIRKTLVVNDNVESFGPVRIQIKLDFSFRPSSAFRYDRSTCRPPAKGETMSGNRLIIMTSLIFTLAASQVSFTLFAEEPDHELFLRYSESPVVETNWIMTPARQIYRGAPATHEDRYRVIPCVAKLRDGTIVVVVEPGGNKPIFIRSTDGAKTWSKPYQGVLGEDVRTISNIGVRKDGRMMAISEKPLRLAHSDDQGKTWVSGKRIHAGPLGNAWVWTGGRPLELKDGTLLVPVAGYLQSGWLSAGVVRSTDNGDSWEFTILGHGNPENEMIFSEPTVAELGDGSLVALLRTEDRSTDAN